MLAGFGVGRSVSIRLQGFDMGWTLDQLAEAKARLLKNGIIEKESEVAKLKLEVAALRQQAVLDDAEARLVLEKSRQEVDKVTSEFFAGARNWGEVKGRLKKKEAEVARLRSKLETLELDEAVEAEEIEGVEERSLSIKITVFNSVVEAIIGRGGENIRRIREVSQVIKEKQIAFSGSIK